MTATPKESASDREILLVGPYGVLGTGVIDAFAANAPWRVTTAARQPAPTYRTQAPPRHISVDLMDREGTIKAFSNLDTVTDLVYAAFVEKPTMAETVAPKIRKAGFADCIDTHESVRRQLTKLRELRIIP